ncbi:afadin-like isoform X2 [Ptychodera flava]|uniref:afadin-like isoform X2 n=1 Tax=Ptychodera flava TaxID=63121 RepID=UPI00396A8F41
MEANQRNREAEREDLARTIAEWNANRLDLFELSAPNEDLEFHGVMRFFFQDAGSKVSTKCVRVSSTASTQDVVETLVEKFHPDMKMLSAPVFALYEVHVNGEERKLKQHERPLLVQLNWGKDDREGRFLLKREADITRLSYFENEDYMQNFKKKSPKKDKRDKRKKDRRGERQKENIENVDDANASMSEKLYSAVPESSFTRSISNPEAVMRRRRQQKLEKRLEEFSGKDGRPDSGGMLKVYGETLWPDVPYRTILVGMDDDAGYIVEETLIKYGRDKDNPADYCLVKVVVPPGVNPAEYVVTGGWGKETIMDDDERPLHLILRYPKNKGSLMFQLKKRPPGYQPRKKRTKKPKSKGDLDGSWDEGDMMPVQQDRLPFLIELAPDGSEIRDYRPQVHRIQPNMTEIGSERSSSGQFLQLFSPNIYPRHCVLTNMDGAVTVTPSNPDAETFINKQRVYETALLHDGAILRFGKMHTYRFCDPLAEKGARRGREMPEAAVNYETTFDVDGHIETVSSPPPHIKEQKGRFDNILPATLEFQETGEDAFLASIISEINGAAVHFKLAPTYCLYMSNRYRQSRFYRPEMSPTERAQRMAALTNKMADMIERTIMESRDVAGALSFWMANASEFLHFLKQDVDLCPVTLDAQDILAAAVQQAFRHLVLCMQQELETSMPAFLDPSDEADNTDHESIIDDDRSMDSHQSWRNRDKMSGRWLSPAARTKYGGRPTLGDVLHTCSSTMTLLRRCRVNAALTIQLFSQLFHFINMWLFNKIVLEPRLGLCTQEWGARLKMRLSAIESWAEKQGLELAADCHLSRIIQAAHLLQAPKSSEDDIASISSTCFKLNSLQLRRLLEQYIPGGGQHRIPPQLIDSVVAVAQNTADELTRSDGREVKLQEDPDLQLPFLLPEDGYSCDIIRGVPNGLQDFLAPLESTDLCRLTIQPSAKGNWTVHFVGGGGDAGKSPVEGFSAVNSQQAPAQQQGIPYDTNIPPGKPEVYTVAFTKGNSGMGLSIVAAKGLNQDRLGIYIKSVVKGGSAERDGRLRDGDQLLEVNGKSLVGVTQERAAELMMQSGSHVTLVAAKQGAIYHGLATLLSQPSPIMQRAMPPRQPRPKSEDILRGPNDNRWRMDPNASRTDRMPMRREAEDAHRARYPMMQSAREADKSKSSPNLIDDRSAADRLRIASTSDLYERYKKDPYYTLPRDKNRHASTSNLIDQPPRQEVIRPTMPPDTDTAMRSKSTSNLDPHNYDRIDSVRPTQSTANMRGYPSPYERDGRLPSTQMGPKTSTPEVQMYNQSPRPGQPQQQQQQRFGLRPTAAYSDQHTPTPQTPSGYPGRSPAYREPEKEQPQPRVETYRPPGRQQTPQQRTYTPQRDEPPPQRYTPQRDEPPPQQRYTPQRDEPPPQHKAYTLPREDLQRKYSPQREEMPVQQKTYIPQREEPLPQQQRPYTPQRDEPPPQQQRPYTPQRDEPPTQQQQPTTYRVADLYAKPYRPPVQQPKQPDPRPYKPEQTSSEPLPPPPPSTNYEDVPSDFPPPPDLPPPGDLGRPYAQQQPLSASQQLLRSQATPPTRSASSTLERDQKKRDLMEDQRRWHEQQKQRMKEESSARMREKQRAQYATLPASFSDRHRHSEYIPQPGEKPSENLNRVSAYGDLPARQPPPVKEKPKPPPKPRTQSQSQVQAAPKITVSAPGISKAADPQRARYDSAIDDLQNRNEAMTAAQQLRKDATGSPASQTSPSPWTREQKEKESAAREQALKRRIDEEIAYLEGLPNRTPEQDEKLSNLKMEVEFQRRVEELKHTPQDDDDADSDKDIKDTALGRGRMLKMMQDDLETARQRIKSNDDQRMYLEEEQERERLERQERRLQQLQQEREDEKMRQMVRQERRDREQEIWLQRQKEMREQQRREIEESNRLQQLEEERQKQMQLEELRKKREAEKAALRERELRREEEERQIRQREEEMRARHEQQKREQEERERQLAEERRRLESQLQVERDPNIYYAKPYQPYREEDDVVHTTVNSYHVPGPEKTQIAPTSTLSSAPPPPERKSSYNTLDRSYGQRPDGQPTQQGPKKVSFYDTAQSIPPQDDYTGSMYRTSTASSSSGGSTASPANTGSNQANQDFVSPNNSNNMATYTTAPTPGVIGAQEIYNDPRNRIQAMQALQKQKTAVPDRMSFRDKMKMFADEIGENSPQEKTKSSKWEREFLAQNTSLNGT